MKQMQRRIETLESKLGKLAAGGGGNGRGGKNRGNKKGGEEKAEDQADE